MREKRSTAGAFVGLFVYSIQILIQNFTARDFKDILQVKNDNTESTFCNFSEHVSFFCIESLYRPDSSGDYSCVLRITIHKILCSINVREINF